MLGIAMEDVAEAVGLRHLFELRARIGDRDEAAARLTRAQRLLPRARRNIA